MAARPLTVMQLLPALDAGGVERSTLEIAAALEHGGHRALVVSAGGRMLPALGVTGARHITLDIGRKSLLTLRHVRALRRLLRDERVDIVHARSRLPAWIGWLAVRGMGVAKPRFVTTVHGLNSPSRYSAVMARGDRVICVSDTVRDYVLHHYPWTDPARLRVIPRGIDSRMYPRRDGVDRDARARVAQRWPQLSGNGPLLLMPGRGTRLKGHADALRLLADLRNGGTDARLWMPGARVPGRDGYIAELEREARDLGVIDALAISEPTNALADAYRASDLVLQLSRKPESFGRTVVEALAIGVPVIGWDHGGVGEVLSALQPEGRVAPGDRTALAERARAFLRQAPALPQRIPYTLSAMQQATLDVYDELSQSR
ncbi:MAG: glycosyltransferase family 4 protein [Xanthomonadales bacterium]|nr:glycosyltransferase family 4 protein [Xanthomonadales bacterium]